MEKDKLKNFVELNREVMDTEQAPEMDWSFVAKPITEVEKKSTKMVKLSTAISLVAASFALLISLNVGYWRYFSKEEPKTPVGVLAIEEQSLELFQVSDEIAEIEMYYASQIDVAMQEVKLLGFANAVENQVQLLDLEYQSLKKELGVNVDNETVIYQMIDNYRLKLELLENAIRSIDTGDELVSNEYNLNLKQNEKYTVYH